MTTTHHPREAGEAISTQDEGKILASILRGMVEACGDTDPAVIYRDDYSSPDGDVYVMRAAELLDAIAPPAAPSVQGLTQKGDVRVIDGCTCVCTDPDIDRWVSHASAAPSVTAEAMAWKVGEAIYADKESAEISAKLCGMPVYTLGVITDQPVAAVTVSDDVWEKHCRRLMAILKQAGYPGDTDVVEAVRELLAQRAAHVAAVTSDGNLRQTLGEALSDELYDMQQHEIEQAQEDAQFIDWTNPENVDRVLDRIMPLLAQRVGTGGDTKEAARYRWLRDESTGQDVHNLSNTGRGIWDAEIDAAMEAKS